MSEVNIIPVRMTCGICGEEYEDYAINGHVSQPIICDKCLHVLIERIENEST